MELQYLHMGWLRYPRTGKGAKKEKGEKGDEQCVLGGRRPCYSYIMFCPEKYQCKTNGDIVDTRRKGCCDEDQN